MSASSGGWTAGVVRHGIADPAPRPTMTTVERDDLCAALGHPGVTYNPNPRTDRTWCACGARTYAGDAAQHGIACCGGPLDRWKETPDAD